jgi:stalled ribosome rescue protein Dom34
MSTFHAVVWMDQSEAHVLQFDTEHVEGTRVRSRSHHKHQGRESDQAAFFTAVWQALDGTREVLLAGPGSGRQAFSKWVDQHHGREAGRLVGSVAADHPSDAQLVALARQYFRRHDQMAADPSQTA